MLGRFVPEFGRIVAQTQFNMYHHFTVDEHTLKAVETIPDIERGLMQKEHPLSTEIFPKIQNRRALYLAMLLHDTGKGKGDQQIEGAKQARSAALRLGLPEDEVELVAWLVGNHLEMSDTAQRRDISDPQTDREIRRACRQPRAPASAPDPHRRRHTRRRARACGTAGRASCCAISTTPPKRRCAAAAPTKQSVRAQLADRAEGARASSGEPRRAQRRLWPGSRTPTGSASRPRQQARHAAALAGGAGQPIVVAASVDAGRSATEVLVSAPDRPGLFADLCGALSASAPTSSPRTSTKAARRACSTCSTCRTRAASRLARTIRTPCRALIEDLRAAAAGGDSVKRPGKAPAPSRRHAAFIISPTVLHRSHSLGRLDRHRGVGPRPARPALRHRARTCRRRPLDPLGACRRLWRNACTTSSMSRCWAAGRCRAEMDDQLTARLVDVLRSNAPTAPRIPAHTLARAPASFDR